MTTITMTRGIFHHRLVMSPLVRLNLRFFCLTVTNIGSLRLGLSLDSVGLSTSMRMATFLRLSLGNFLNLLNLGVSLFGLTTIILMNLRLSVGLAILVSLSLSLFSR
jgi:hypothetical protein